MIDLKELEDILEEALAKETSESLSVWLKNQRENNLENFFGAGCIAKFKGSPFSFSMDTPKDTVYYSSDNNNPSGSLATAA